LIHPQYDSARSLYANDLAVLPLSGMLPAGISYPPLLPAWITLSPGAHLESVGYGGRQGDNRRTWMDVVFERGDGGTIFTQNGLSVSGDSGGPLFFRNGGWLYLAGIHSTAITEGADVSAAAVGLRAQSEWLRQVTQTGFSASFRGD
jgi:hypothetical protein